MLRLHGATMAFGPRKLWSDLDLDVHPGEFITVLGANGSGKTTLLKAILGLQSMTAGSTSLLGRPVTRGDRRVGYIPQQRLIPPGTPMRGRDLVTLGVNGHRFGLPFTSSAGRAAVDSAIAQVEAEAFADDPIGNLSGGEQQRLRVAQALVSDPALLLCDEPLISLDLYHQHAVSELLDKRRRVHGTPILFITHDINPVLGMTDRILYLADGRHRIGHADEVLRSDVLSELYGSRVDVARVGDRVIVVGGPDHTHHADESGMAS